MFNLWRRSVQIAFLFLFCLGAASAAQASVLASTPDQQSVPNLFEDPLITPTAILPLEPAAVRARYVQVNFTTLENAALLLEGGAMETRLSLNLFDDVTLTALLSRLERFDTGFVLSGAVEGVDGSAVTLSVVNQTLSASVALPQLLYQVRFVNNFHAVYEIDYILAMPESEPEMIPPALPEGMVFPQATGDDDGSQIDVMVVYTPLAMLQLGGTSATNAYINQAISDANSAYANSQINQRMHLVHSAQVSYAETSYDLSSILQNHLTPTSDGNLDTVHTLRNSYNADLVVLLVQKTGLTCGVGWLMDSNFVNIAFAPYGFSVVNVSSNCQSGSLYTLAHETGHNMGAQHNPEDAGSQGAYSYSYGHWASDYSFRTVMAYDCPSGCTRIQYFSNPNVSYNGLATGTSGRNNARTLNNTASVVAKFRDGTHTAPSDLAAVTASQYQINLTWTDNSDDETAFYLERAPASGGTWQQIALPANTTSYQNNNLPCGNNFQYRVRAKGGNGYSAYSNIAYASTYCAPNPPSNLTATTLSTSSIRLNWTDNSSDENGFVIYSLDDMNEYYADPDMEEETIDSLFCGTTYRFRVTAYNAYGESTPSNTVTADTVICPPEPNPFTLNASALSQSRIRLTWQDTAREANYIVERSSNGTNWTQFEGIALDANTTQFDYTLLPCGSSYYYRVRAVNAGGEAVSNTQHISTNACGAPSTPGGVTVTPISVYILQVSWNDILDDEDSYRIERSLNGVSGWSVVGYTQEDEVVFIDANAVDADGQPPATLWYRITAINGYGVSSPSSSVSGSTYPQGNFFPYMQFTP
jgi:hypothetical protein